MNRELITQPIGTVREVIGNNRRAAYVVVAVGLVLQLTGNIPDMGMPTWWPAALIAVGGAVLAGRYAAKRIGDLIPEPDGILIVEFDSGESGGGAIYELSEDAFEDMRVLGGDLFQWDRSSRRVYEVRNYNAQHNVALANWRESKPGSALAEPPTVEDALTAIRELREDLEPDVAKARETRRRMRGIVRQLDKDRAEAQQQILDETVAPDLGDSSTVSEIIDDQIPEELHPETVSVEDALKNGHAENDGDGEVEDDDDEKEAEPTAHRDALGVFS